MIPARLKRTEAFRAVYRRGRWAKGSQLSIGVLPNQIEATRVGLRTRRGLKGAVVRNRLKRQLRAILFAGKMPFRGGIDLVVVIHPQQPRIPATTLEQELRTLCRQNGSLRS